MILKHDNHKKGGFYFDDTLAQNLDHLKKAVAKNWDGFVMVDGVEGSAKTTLAAAMCYYLDPKFNLDNVVFTQEQFFKAVDVAKPGTAIQWDEFVFGGLSTEALNKVQNALIKKITTIRKKRLYVVLIMPWFFMMRPYFAVGRSRCLIHCHTPDGITRGIFKFYSYAKKQRLYYYGKKEYRYNVKCNFTGRFVDTFKIIFNEQEYDEKKEAAIKDLTEEKENKKANKKEERYKMCASRLITYIRDTHNISWNELSSISKMPKTTICNWYAIPEGLTY